MSSCGTDPLVHHGRHFGRTVHALCTVQALLNNGLLRMGELADQSEESFSHESVLFLLSYRWSTHQRNRERREHRVFQRLLEMVPGLEERLVEGSDENVVHIAELVSTCIDIPEFL